MAISFVSRTSALADNVALPAFVPGDVAIAHALNKQVLFPSAPAGWTTILSQDMTSSNKAVCAYRVLQAGDTSSGVWGNTVVQLQVMVYRGCEVSGPVGAASSAINSGGSGLCFVPDLTLQNTEGRSWVVWLGAADSGACPGNTMHSRTHPNQRLVNRSSGQTTECLGHADSSKGETNWISVGDMTSDNGSFDKGFFSIELLAGPSVNSVRIVNNVLEANRFFVRDGDNKWRISDKDDIGAIVGRDLSHVPVAARIFTLD